MKLYNSRIDMVNDLIKPNLNILEIGVFCGDFSDTLFHLNPLKLYLVDMWEPNAELISGDQDGNNVRFISSESALNKVKEKYSQYNNISIQQMKSTDFLLSIEDNSLDMIYIDGDHSYEGVKSDLLLSFNKIKNGGYIMGHDYEMNMNKAKSKYDFGVKKAVDEFCINYNQNIMAKGLDGCVSFCIKISK